MIQFFLDDRALDHSLVDRKAFYLYKVKFHQLMFQLVFIQFSSYLNEDLLFKSLSSMLKSSKFLVSEHFEVLGKGTFWSSWKAFGNNLFLYIHSLVKYIALGIKLDNNKYNQNLPHIYVMTKWMANNYFLSWNYIFGFHLLEVTFKVKSTCKTIIKLIVLHVDFTLKMVSSKWKPNI